MDKDEPILKSKKDFKEFTKQQKEKLEEVYTSGEKKKRKTQFQKGNKCGVRFGGGQSRVGNGRPRKTISDTTVIKEMKAAAETYGLSANEIAVAMVKLAMDTDIEPRFRFLFMKEINLRIFGQPKSSLEDTLRHINDKVDKLYELTMPLLEATAVGDGVALVRELMSQGKLDEVVKQIEGEKV